MGFTLRIINAPSGGTHWSAHFYSAAEGRFISPPSALALDEVWDCAFNPYGATDLRVLVLDFVHARTVLDVSNLGPVNDGRAYEFNCSTRVLGEVAPELVPCEITITAPNSAAGGETVNASVKVKNVSPYHYSYKATIYAVPDLYPDYVIGSIDQVITSGSSVLRNVSFTMPDCNVTVFVWVERWAADHWVYDNSASRVVSLEVPATFHLSVYVPPWAAGGYIDPGSGDYPAYSTVKLTARPLSGYQFTGWGGDASGTSTTYNLYMNSDKYVEAYFEKVPVPEEYAGTISRKELEYDETRGAIPVY